MENRYDWIDVLKGIGMIAVIMGHSGLPPVINDWITSFHMPLFFFISGFLFRQKDSSYVVYLKKKTRSLLLPYLVFTIICIICRLLLKTDGPITVTDILLNGWYGLALWFLPVLFLTEALFFLIAKYAGSRKIVLLFILFISAGIGYWLSIREIFFAYKLEVVFTALAFYGTGYLVNGSVKKNILGLGGFALVALTCTGLALNFIVSLLNKPPLVMAYNVIGNPLLAYLGAFTGIIFVLAASVFISEKFSSKNKLRLLLLYIGQNTLVLLAVHQLIKMALIEFVSHFSFNKWVVIGIKHVIFWILLFLVIELVNRYMYWAIGKKKPEQLKSRLN